MALKSSIKKYSPYSEVKAGLRIQKLLERQAHHPLQKKAKDAIIVERMAALPLFEKAKTILFYLPIKGEVDVSLLFNRFHHQKNFALPRMNDENLDLYEVKDLHHTEKGPYEILEPLRSLPQKTKKDIDLALIAGVVFDEHGHRIGYGKGFYDRLLVSMSCPKIGIAYDFQIVNNIPGESHDVPMNMVVTEQRILTFKT